VPKLRKVSGEKVIRILCNIGTLKGILKLAKVDEDEFSKNL
jgi:hypothetical protein